MADFDPQELGSFGPEQFNPQEMGNLSPAEGKQTLEILVESAKREQPNLDVNKFAVDIAKAVKGNVLFLLRIANTVFVLRPLGGTSLEFHTATIEDPQTLVQRFQTAIKTLTGLGCTHVVTYYSDPKYTRLIKMMGMRGGLKNVQVQQVEADGPNPVYQFEADI